MPIPEAAPLARCGREEGWAIAQINTNGATYGLTRAISDENRHQGHPWRVSREAMERLKEEVCYVLQLTGSRGKA